VSDRFIKVYKQWENGFIKTAVEGKSSIVGLRQIDTAPNNCSWNYWGYRNLRKLVE